ncbi:MAG: trigger factor [Bacillota bacterium]|nr:trigger factor [Bacillota bacterium]
MSYTLENVEKNKVKFTIEVSPEVFEEAMQKSYIKNVKKINLAGFRKGKAPRKMIEKAYGAGVFYEDAVNFIIPDAYDNAVEESKINPVCQPDIDIDKIGEDEHFVFTATVYTKPEVTIGEYKGVTIDKIENKVTDEDVDSELNKKLEQNARIITIDNRAAEDKDMTTIDFEGFVDGVAFEGGKGTDHELTLGSGAFIPGFEEQIIGKNIGEEFDVNVTFPEEYHSEELKGKEAVFKVKLKELKVKELPALDDDFAKDVSEFDTLDELRSDIRSKKEKEAEEKTKREIESAVLDEVVKNTEIDLPECMVDNQVEKMVQDYGYRLQSQGINLDMYLQYTQMTVDQLKEQMKPSAKDQVIRSLVLEKVAELEKIEATDEDVEAQIAKTAELYKMEIAKLKELMGDNYDAVKQDVVTEKTFDFLVANAKQVKKAKAEKEDQGEEKKTTKKGAAKTAEDDGEKKTATKKAETEKDTASKSPAKKSAAKKEEK